jgi:4-amino-4-deoxy-L-arabinose transferase-like glycosyltransferase
VSDVGVVSPKSGVAAFAWRPVAIAVGAAAAALLATIGRYGFHRDELYFLAASRHLAWGYDDQPPLTPFVIRVETTLFGDSVVAVRIAPTLFALALIVLAALSARELAGPDPRLSRRAQAIAAAATAPSLLVLLGGHLFATATGDLLCWATVLWLVTRWLRTGDGWLWPVIGVVMGLGLLNNNLVALLAFALVVGAAVAGPRTVFTDRWMWLGALIALVIWSPNLIWQATNGWPEIQMTKHISSGDERANLLPFQIEATVLLTPVWVAGWWSLTRSARLRAYRLFAVAYPLVLVVVLFTGGKRYYPGGWYPLLLGAGAVAVVGWLDRAKSTPARRRRMTLFGTGVAITAVISILIGLPVLPVRTYASIADVNKDLAETVGWPRFADTVAGVYKALPADERADVTLLAHNYGEAGALAHYGPALGLPTAYSGHNGYRRFGMPSGDGPTIAVGYTPAELAPYWSSCVVRAHIDDGVGVANQEQGNPVLFCTGRKEPWPTVWAHLLYDA